MGNDDVALNHAARVGEVLPGEGDEVVTDQGGIVGEFSYVQLDDVCRNHALGAVRTLAFASDDFRDDHLMTARLVEDDSVQGLVHGRIWVRARYRPCRDTGGGAG